MAYNHSDTWKQLTYLKKGIFHEQNGTNCQDSVLVRENEKCLVAALADGLGSLKYSEIAADAATSAVCEFFLGLELWDGQFSRSELAKYIHSVVVNKIKSKANELRLPLSEMDCTLVFVCVMKRMQQAVIGHLGDSAICIISESNYLAINDTNNSANGTNAILERNAIEHFDIRVYDLLKNKIQGFILSSDGLDNELYMKGSTHVNKAAELYFNAVSIGNFAYKIVDERVSELIENGGALFDDDISIAVLSKANAAVELPADPTWLCVCGYRNYLQSTYCQHCHKDFSVLYQNIRFKEHGGKAEFFAKINQNLKEELRVLEIDTKKKQPSIPIQPAGQPKTGAEASVESLSDTMITEPLTESEADSDTNADMGEAKKTTDNHMGTNKEQRKENTNGKKHTALVKVIILAVACCVIGHICESVNYQIFLAKNIRELSEKMDQLTSLVQKIEFDYGSKLMSTQSNSKSEASMFDVPNSFIVLESGDYYWGDLDDSLPDGNGILLVGDSYYIGNFKHGLKDGIFVVVSSDREPVSEYYENGIWFPASTYNPLDEGNLGVSSSDYSFRNAYETLVVTNMQTKPGKDNELVITLPIGSVVYLLDISEENNSDGYWICVRAEDGHIGWILKEVIGD